MQVLMIRASGFENAAFFSVLLRHRRTGFVAKAGDHVIIDHAGCLHVCIHDRASDKFESTLLEVFAQRIGFLRSRRNVRVFSQLVLLRFAVHELPDVVAKSIVFLLNIEDYAEMNAVYSEVFGDRPPARSPGRPWRSRAAGAAARPDRPSYRR